MHCTWLWANITWFWSGSMLLWLFHLRVCNFHVHWWLPIVYWRYEGRNIKFVHSHDQQLLLMHACSLRNENEWSALFLFCNWLRFFKGKGWMDTMVWLHLCLATRFHRCHFSCWYRWFHRRFATSWLGFIRGLCISCTSRYACTLVCLSSRAWWWPLQALCPISWWASSPGLESRFSSSTLLSHSTLETSERF